MDLKQLLNDDRGVSPVIGVILMVAITVILAAVIGTFVLGLGSNVGNNAPSATFNYDYENFNDDSAANTVTITDQGGDQLDGASLNVSVPVADGSTVSNVATQEPNTPLNVTNSWPDQVTAGDSYEVESASADGSNDAQTIASGEDIQVIWQSSGGSSSIISSSTTPN